MIASIANRVHCHVTAPVTALVIPVHPDARDTISAGYDARLAATPDDIPALTGASFARWWFFQYAQAIHTLDHLVALAPDWVADTTSTYRLRVTSFESVSTGELVVTRD